LNSAQLLRGKGLMNQFFNQEWADYCQWVYENECAGIAAAAANDLNELFFIGGPVKEGWQFIASLADLLDSADKYGCDPYEFYRIKDNNFDDLVRYMSGDKTEARLAAARKALGQFRNQKEKHLVRSYPARNEINDHQVVHIPFDKLDNQIPAGIDGKIRKFTCSIPKPLAYTKPLPTNLVDKRKPILESGQDPLMLKRNLKIIFDVSESENLAVKFKRENPDCEKLESENQIDAKVTRYALKQQAQIKQTELLKKRRHKKMKMSAYELFTLQGIGYTLAQIAAMGNVTEDALKHWFARVKKSTL